MTNPYDNAPPMNPEVFSAWQTMLFAYMGLAAPFPVDAARDYLRWLEANAEAIAPELASELINTGRIDSLLAVIDAVEQLATLRTKLMQAAGNGKGS